MLIGYARAKNASLLLVAALCLTATVPAFGEVIFEDLKLQASDGDVGDLFGNAVAMDGGIIAIGAPGDDDNGINSGAAYLIDAATGAELLKLTSDDGATGDNFGHSIAMAGGLVAVGAPGRSDHGGASGAAYVFSAATGSQLAKLTADDAEAGDEFGNAIDIDGGIVAVGAWRADDFGDGSGAAYLFDASTGAQLDKLLPDTGNNYQTFGVSIALDDGIVAVGSRTFFVLNEGFTWAKAHLFDVSSGNLLRVLKPDIENYNGDQGGHFADCLAMDGGLVAVGAPSRSIFYDFSGAAYVFDASTGEQLHFIYPADGHDRDHFGRSISIHGGLIAIGADEDDDSAWSAGSAYLYDASDASLVDKLLVSDGASFDHFGTSIALEDGIIASGAIGFGSSGTQTGYVAVYGSGTQTAVETETPLAGVSLMQAYPNPFNPKTTIRFELAEAGEARLEIFDATGRRLSTLLNERLTAGQHITSWNGRDDAGRALPSGLYFAKLTAPDHESATKLVLSK